MRATPPSLRISAGTRSSAITAQAPAFSAILACSALVTSMMTPPFSISARPTFNLNCSFKKFTAVLLGFTQIFQLIPAPAPVRIRFRRKPLVPG